MEYLDFDYNWNGKLYSDSFLCLRNSGHWKKGAEVMVRFKKLELGRAKILEVKKVKTEELNEFVTRLDTGYDVPATLALILKIYKHIPQFMSLILVKFESNSALRTKAESGEQTLFQ